MDERFRRIKGSNHYFTTFYASNELKIGSCKKPGLYVNAIYLRGYDKSQDFKISTFKKDNLINFKNILQAIKEWDSVWIGWNK